MTILQGSCTCGANTITLSSPPIARFVCHCLVCQQYTGQDFSDVSVFLRPQIQQMDIKATTFKRYKLPPNIQRGKCKHCQQPSIEFGIFGKLVIIASKNLHPQAALPPAEMHIFYHRRQHDIEDNLPKYQGFVISQWMTSKLLFHKLLQQL